MRKIDIAQRIQKAAGISLEEEASAVLDSILELFKAILQKGEPISIPNFGKFEVRKKTPRPGRNPITGEGVMIAARRVVVFRASSQIKTEVNSVQAEQQEAEILLPKGK